MIYTANLGLTMSSLLPNEVIMQQTQLASVFFYVLAVVTASRSLR